MNKIIVVIGAIFSSVLFLVDCSLVNIKKEKIISKIYIYFQRKLLRIQLDIMKIMTLHAYIHTLIKIN